MADKKKTAKTSSKPKSTKEKPSFGENIKAFFSNLFKEIKKIKWADGKTVLKNTLVVLLVVLVVGVGVWITDWLLTEARDYLIEFANNREAAETAVILCKGCLNSLSLL